MLPTPSSLRPEKGKGKVGIVVNERAEAFKAPGVLNLIACLLLSSILVMYHYQKSGIYNLIYIAIVALFLLGIHRLFHKGRGGIRLFYYISLFLFVMIQIGILSHYIDQAKYPAQSDISFVLKIDIALFLILLIINLYYMISAPVHIWFKANKLARKGLPIDTLAYTHPEAAKPFHTKPWLRFVTRCIDSFVYIILFFCIRYKPVILALNL